jgi:hypothetical protein
MPELDIVGLDAPPAAFGGEAACSTGADFAGMSLDGIGLGTKSRDAHALTVWAWQCANSSCTQNCVFAPDRKTCSRGPLALILIKRKISLQIMNIGKPGGTCPQS